MAGAEKGRFIVIDGNDGSGKGTQLELLKSHLEGAKIDVETFDFPQYDTFHGSMVGRFLSGEFGSLENASPYLLTYPFAMDRMAVAPQIKKALDRGKVVLANRYVTSNMAHQSGRLPKEERKAYVDWDMEFEYGQNGLPKEDVVIYLFVPHKKAQELMNNKDRIGRSYAKGKHKDMVEEDEGYLTGAEEAYLELSERFDHWVKIICVDEDGKMLPKDEINTKIREELKNRKII